VFNHTQYPDTVGDKLLVALILLKEFKKVLRFKIKHKGIMEKEILFFLQIKEDTFYDMFDGYKQYRWRTNIKKGRWGRQEVYFNKTVDGVRHRVVLRLYPLPDIRCDYCMIVRFRKMNLRDLL